MNIEQQCCSLELAKKLKELGVKQESYFWFNHLSDRPDGTTDVSLNHFKMSTASENISAFSVAELGEMLPENIKWERRLAWLLCKKEFLFNEEKTPVYTCEYSNSEGLSAGFMKGYNEADARAKMLIYLLENKLISA